LFTGCAVFLVALGVGHFFLRHQAILGINDAAFAVHSEAFRKRLLMPASRFARLEIDCLARELTFGLRRRRGERDFRHSVCPYRLDDRLEDRNRDMAASRAAAQRAALAIGVVVARPRRWRRW